MPEIKPPKADYYDENTYCVKFLMMKIFLVAVLEKNVRIANKCISLSI